MGLATLAVSLPLTAVDSRPGVRTGALVGVIVMAAWWVMGYRRRGFIWFADLVAAVGAGCHRHRLEQPRPGAVLLLRGAVLSSPVRPEARHLVRRSGHCRLLRRHGRHGQWVGQPQPARPAPDARRVAAARCSGAARGYGQAACTRARWRRQPDPCRCRRGLVVVRLPAAHRGDRLLRGAPPVGRPQGLPGGFRGRGGRAAGGHRRARHGRSAVAAAGAARRRAGQPVARRAVRHPQLLRRQWWVAVAASAGIGVPGGAAGQPGPVAGRVRAVTS
ncbi:hypothetical protein BH20ACT7_BH20ACT7_06670 [soil metagenome]